jgi:uncharacterized membrane protein YfcA
MRRGAVRWDLVRGMAPGIVLGGLLSGAGLFAVLKGQGLALVFAGFIGFSATQMLLDRKPKPRRARCPARRAGGVGPASAGRLGPGRRGWRLHVGALHDLVQRAARQAVGTSAALGFPIALASTLGYVIAGWGLPPRCPAPWATCTCRRWR